MTTRSSAPKYALDRLGELAGRVSRSPSALRALADQVDAEPGCAELRLACELLQAGAEARTAGDHDAALRLLDEGIRILRASLLGEPA